MSSNAAQEQFSGSMTEPPLFQNRHFRVELLPGEAIVRVTRLARPFTSAEDAMYGCRPMLAALDALGRASHYLLFDSRLAIGRNDPEYESWFAPHRRDLVRDFPKAAVVISTSVGRLHSQRLLNADAAAERFRVFDDYVMALAFVRTAFRASSRPAAPLSSPSPTSGVVAAGTSALGSPSSAPKSGPSSVIPPRYSSPPSGVSSSTSLLPHVSTGLPSSSRGFKPAGPSSGSSGNSDSGNSDSGNRARLPRVVAAPAASNSTAGAPSSARARTATSTGAHETGSHTSQTRLRQARTEN